MGWLLVLAMIGFPILSLLTDFVLLESRRTFQHLKRILPDEQP